MMTEWCRMGVKAKAESAKTELQLNIKKTKGITSRELYSFKVDNEETEIDQNFLCFINQKGNSN